MGESESVLRAIGSRSRQNPFPHSPPLSNGLNVIFPPGRNVSLPCHQKAKGVKAKRFQVILDQEADRALLHLPVEFEYVTALALYLCLP